MIVDDGLRAENDIGASNRMVMHLWLAGYGPACGQPVAPDRSLGSTPSPAHVTCPACVLPDLANADAVEEWLRA